MEWHKRTDETHTTVTGEFVLVLRRTRHITPGATEQIGEWHGSVQKYDGTVMLQANDMSRDVVVAACNAWLLALAVAQERDPLTT